MTRTIEALRAVARRLEPLETKFVFLGGAVIELLVDNPAVSGAEKHALLRTADLFVLPSYSEGFPMAVLEAAAHRIPVVQTDECNFPELTAAGGAWECRPESESVERALREALTADDAAGVRRGGRRRPFGKAHNRSLRRWPLGKEGIKGKRVG